MTYHPEERNFQTINGSIDYTFRDLVTGQESHNHYSNSLTYETDWKSRGGPNSPSWPSVRSENSYFLGKTATRYNPFSLRATRTVGTFSEVYEGTQTYGYASPATDGSPYSLGPLNRALDINYGHVVNKILSNLSQSKVNALQFIAEREQTKNLVISTATRIAEAIRSVRRGNFAGAVRNLSGSKGHRGVRGVAGGIPEQWLALQYGWKPLLADVYGACEELARLTTYEPPVYSAAGRAVTAVESSTYTVPGDSGWIPDMVWGMSGAQVHGRGVVYAKVGASIVNIASRTGISNPLSLGWELLPYSFVVDWFYPVGDFLEQCNATDGLQFLKGFIAQKVTIPWNGKAAKTNFSSGGWNVTIGGNNPSASVITYKRTALSGFPRARWPDFKDPFSSTHVANALSLLATAFGRGPRVR